MSRKHGGLWVAIFVLFFGLASCDWLFIDEEGDGLDVHKPKVCVSYTDLDTGEYYLRVKCREGAGDWTQVGSGSLNDDTTDEVQETSVALDEDGVPYVAYIVSDSVTLKKYLYVKRWDEDSGQWVSMGETVQAMAASTASSHNMLGISVDPEGAVYVSMGIGDDGAITLVYSWFDLAKTDILVKTWNGTEWVSVGEEALNISDSSGLWELEPQIVVADEDLIYVTWAEYDGEKTRAYVKRWKAGNSWTLLGGTYVSADDVDAYDVRIGIDEDAVPYVTFQEYGVDISRIVTSYWDDDEEVWTGLEDLSDVEYPMELQDQAVDYLGRPHVLYRIWNENYLFYVKRWEGNTWSDLGGDLKAYDVPDVYRGYASLTVSRSPLEPFDGIPYAIWADSPEVCGNMELWSMFWDGSTWQGLEKLNEGTEYMYQYADVKAR